jgi:hypothetical protein
MKDEPLKLQFEAFLNSVETRSQPKLSGRVARRTLEVALEILDKIDQHTSIIENTLQNAMSGGPLSSACQP